MIDYSRIPGPGDPETWGPCTGHPLDPRTVDVRDTTEFEEMRDKIIAKRFKDLNGWFQESFCEYNSDENLKELSDAVQAGEAQKVGDIVIDMVYRGLTPSDEDVIEELNYERG